jgi:hypothetical protein
MRDNDPDIARALARDLLAAIGKAQAREPEPLLKRFDRIIAASMPPALAYALGAAKRGYHKDDALSVLLRREGLQTDGYSWLSERGEAIAAIFEEAIEAAVPHAVEPEPTPDAAPSPTEAPLEQPVAPTFTPATPDPTPPGVPDIPPAAIGITATDIVGDPSLLEVR